MIAVAPKILENRLTELMMRELAPCDLGDGIEVLHDVEAVEIEMDCDLHDDAPVEASPAEVLIKAWFDELWLDPNRGLNADDLATHPFIRDSAPYERIEIKLDTNAFVRATIEDARQSSRSLRRA